MLHKVRQRNHTVSEHDMTNSLITNKGDKTIISKKSHFRQWPILS